MFEACCCRESSRWGSEALRLTVSYLKYIFVDGTFIDVVEDTFGSWYRDNIYPVVRKEASFPVTSSMKKPASQNQPPRSASAYGLLTACFMPLYTWLDVYRHRIPTDRFFPSFFLLREIFSARFYESCDLIDRHRLLFPLLPPHPPPPLCCSREPFSLCPFLSNSRYRSANMGYDSITITLLLPESTAFFQRFPETVVRLNSGSFDQGKGSSRFRTI